MSCTFTFSTVDLQVNADSQNGYMNLHKTFMIFKNLNFRNLFGTSLYDNYNKFKIKLLQVISNTSLILNFNPTVPKIYFTFEDFTPTTVINAGDRNNYGDATLTGVDISIVTSDKVNGIYSLFRPPSAGVGYLSIAPFQYPVSSGITICLWVKYINGGLTTLFENSIYRLSAHSNGFISYQNNITAQTLNTLSNIIGRFNWHHICITHATDGTVNIFANNVFATNGNITYSTTLLSDVKIATGIRLNLDDVRYYDTILSDEERGYIYTNIFPLDGNYDNQDACMSVKLGGLPFYNTNPTVALIQAEQTKNNIIAGNGETFYKPQQTGQLSINLLDISTNVTSTNLQSDSMYLFEVEGIRNE